MPERTIDWGGSDSPYETHVDRDNDGRFVVADDTSGGTVLLEYDESANNGSGGWISRGPVDLDGNDISGVGELSSTAVSTDSVENSAIGDSINYIDPRWLVRSDAIVVNEVIDSLDGVAQNTSGSGSITLQNTRVELNTGSTSGSTARLSDFISLLDLSFDNDSAFSADVGPQHNSDEIFYATHGRPARGEEGYGFKFTAGDIQGTVHNGTSENTTTLVSSYSTGAKKLRAEFTSGTDVEFFVDGTSQGTLSSGLPSGSVPNGNIYEFSVENTAASDKELRVGHYNLVQIP